MLIWRGLVLLVWMMARHAVAEDGEQKIAELGRCQLENGKTIEPCRLGYRVYGDLSRHRDRVVMGLTWYNGVSGDLRAAIFSESGMVDTREFVGVAVDAFGDGISSSPSNQGGPQHGADFPQFTIRDMVAAEFRLATEVLGLKQLYAVAGISMGGMQVFEWVAAHPEFVTKAVAVAGTPKQSSFDLLHWQIWVDAAESDPGYMGGRYTTEPHLRLANELGQLTGMSPGYFVRKTSAEDFGAYYARMQGMSKLDANDRVWQTRAMLAQDVFRGRPASQIAEARRVTMLIATAEQDHTVNPVAAIAWAKESGAETYVSTGDCGHRITECDGDRLTAKVREFLLEP